MQTIRQSLPQNQAGDNLAGRTFLALCLVSFLNSFAVAPFVSLFPVYVEADLGRLPLFTANLRALMLVLGGVSAMIGGWLCDTVGRKATLLIGLAGSVFNGLIFRWSDPAVLTALIFLIGSASGPWSTAGQSYLITSVNARRLGMGGAVYFLCNTAGNALGSLVTGLLKENWTFGQIGTAMTIAMAMTLVLALVVLPSRQVPLSRGYSQPRLNLWPAYRTLLRRRDVHLLVGLRFLITSFWGMATLLLPLLVYRTSASEAMAAYYAAVSLALAAGVQLLTGFLQDRYGRFWPLMAAASGVVASTLGLGFFCYSLPGLFLFGTTLTCTAWAVSTLIPALINDIAAPDEKNRLVGLGHMVWSAAMVAGGIAGGWLVEIQPALPFFTGTFLTAGGTLCAWHLCRHLANRGK